MICLKSVIEPITRAMTTFLHVGASTPVVSSCEVVRITGDDGLQLLESAQVPAADVALVGGHPADVVGELAHPVGIAGC